MKIEISKVHPFENPQDAYNFLEMIEGLPPIEYLGYCDTPDQQTHWNELRFYFRQLQSSFSFYFSGQEDTVLSEMPEKIKDFYILLRDRYLSFYTMIQGNWRNITKEAESKGYDLSALSITNPGEALMRFLENDCGAMFFVCLAPNYKSSPNKIREMAKLRREVVDLLNSGEKLVGGKLKKVERYNQVLNAQRQPFAEFIEFGKFCEFVCSQAKKGSTAYRHYLYYKSLGEDLDAKIQAMCHPSKKRKGQHWVSGDCYPV